MLITKKNRTKLLKAYYIVEGVMDKITKNFSVKLTKYDKQKCYEAGCDFEKLMEIKMLLSRII